MAKLFFANLYIYSIKISSLEKKTIILLLFIFIFVALFFLSQTILIIKTNKFNLIKLFGPYINIKSKNKIKNEQTSITLYYILFELFISIQN